MLVGLKDAEPYAIGEEIWQVPLADAIGEQADCIAHAAGPELLDDVTPAGVGRLRERVVAEMTAALVAVGDTYIAPDGITYLLADQPQRDCEKSGDRLAMMDVKQSEPVVTEVMRFEDLPPGSSPSRCAVVRWSDGTESQALPWFGDEILVCEGDLIGKPTSSCGRCIFIATETGSSPHSRGLGFAAATITRNRLGSARQATGYVQRRDRHVTTVVRRGIDAAAFLPHRGRTGA